MKRFISLLLMVTTLLTFTQKVMAFAPLMESETSMSHCEMENMQMDSVNCETEMGSMENCQSNCEMMTVVSVLHFVESEPLLSFNISQMRYTPLVSPASYYYPETLYRPPFIS
ncbi:MAG: hypothetical protein GY951_01315 [Psychromonas sp.]|nr:hypothetical protein [Psychromonas sp.]